MTLLREPKLSPNKNRLSYDILHYNMAGLYYVDYLNKVTSTNRGKGSSEFKMNPVVYSVGISTILAGCVMIFPGFSTKKLIICS
jgi:hypothetical protein